MVAVAAISRPDDDERVARGAAGAQRAGEVVADERHAGRGGGRAVEGAADRVAGPDQPTGRALQLEDDVARGPGELHDEVDPGERAGVGEELQQHAAGPLGVDPHAAAA